MSKNSSSSDQTISSNDNGISTTSPRRFIYNSKDLQQFRSSPTRRELLSFVNALGRSTITSSYVYKGVSSSSPSDARGEELATGDLEGLSPGMASLHGSLRCMAEEWIAELPPNEASRARFGNPMFKLWHNRLTGSSDGDSLSCESGGRSSQIILTMMNCHLRHTVPMMEKKKEIVKDSSTSSDISADDQVKWDHSLLEKCSEAGYKAASTSSTGDTADDLPEFHDTATTTTTAQHDKVLKELCSYFNLSFGHPIRIDYGTGHESSFLVFLYSLGKVGIFGNDKSQMPNDDTMAPIALSILSQYLQVCRGLQTEYMLEPAGSHGVWGLDDYHCVPFYVGACQLQNPRFLNGEGYTPSFIHNDERLASRECQGLMYFQCIRYIKTIKRGVPFFESSPMLDDISRLKSWSKVAEGLLRLYEGEVLDKLPVVQHFLFGDIFKATWTPSEAPRPVPSRTFNVGSTMNPNNNLPMEFTRAPWAK